MTAPKHHPHSIAEFESLRGVDLGSTPWLDVSQSTIDAFAEVTGDRQWIHLDTERAVGGPFGTTIAHGLFTLAIGPVLTGQLIGFEGFEHSLNYGYNRVRFPHPLPVGVRVRMSARVTEVTRADAHSALVTIEQVFAAEGIEKPVCVAASLSYVTESTATESASFDSAAAGSTDDPDGRS